MSDQPPSVETSLALLTQTIEGFKSEVTIKLDAGMTLNKEQFLHINQTMEVDRLYNESRFKSIDDAQTDLDDRMSNIEKKHAWYDGVSKGVVTILTLCFGSAFAQYVVVHWGAIFHSK
jgi:hypothetical protein